MNVKTVFRAFLIGTDIGTETIWAPTTSLCFQPNPLAEPYSVSMVAGAVSGVLWQVRHAGFLIWIGRAI